MANLEYRREDNAGKTQQNQSPGEGRSKKTDTRQEKQQKDEAAPEKKEKADRRDAAHSSYSGRGPAALPQSSSPVP